MNKIYLLKAFLVLVVLFALGWFSPLAPIDPWKLFSPKTLLNLIFAITFVQTLAVILISFLGARLGATFTGFLGGLVSSTATTASLARQSVGSQGIELSTEFLTFLSDTLAMLVEALSIALFGATDHHFKILMLFMGPIGMTGILIFRQARQVPPVQIKTQNAELKIMPILKLTLFIVVVLTSAKIFQKNFGNAGLLVLTFVASLFEIHGSVIANLQLYDFGSIDLQFLGGLLAVSMVAAGLSKFFIVATIGSRSLTKAVARATAFLLLSLVTSGLVFSLI